MIRGTWMKSTVIGVMLMLLPLAAAAQETAGPATAESAVTLPRLFPVGLGATDALAVASAPAQATQAGAGTRR